MIFNFSRKARPSQEPKANDDSCPVCGVSFAMYPAETREKIRSRHIGAFHPEYAQEEMKKI